MWLERTAGRLPSPSIAAPTRYVERISSEEGAASLREFSLAINGGCIEIIREPALGALPFGILNIHPGLLPNYRGCTVVEWALYNGDPVGVTAHLMDEGIDTGPLVAQAAVDVSDCADYEAVRVKVYQAGFALAAAAAADLLAGRARPVPQGPGRYWKPIEPEKMAAVRARVARRASDAAFVADRMARGTTADQITADLLAQTR